MTTAVLEKTVVDTAQTISQSYRFALDPTSEQISLLNSHIGGARACYNKLLGLVKENWDENRAKKAAGAEVAREDYLGTYHLDLQKLWYTHRAEMAPWYQENGSSIYNYACLNLSKSFANWRAGRAGFPTFKSKGQSGSASLLSGAVGLTDTHHVRISRIGPVKTYESTRKIYRHLERGTGRITSATISRRGGKYFISFTLEVRRQVPLTRAPERVIGIDAGLTTLYTGATTGGEEVLRVENPRNYQHAEEKLAKAKRVASRRQGPSKRPGNSQAPSNRWKQANAKVQRIETTTRNRRLNHIHEITSALAKNYDLIVVEDLNIKGMMKNKKLAKHIADAAWGEFYRQLEYKAKWYGSTIVRADRFFASSKICSSCGAKKANLPLSERTYHCEVCGLSINRDLNAAINLARWTSTSTSAGTSSVAGRGGKVRPRRRNIVDQAHPDEASTEPSPAVDA